MINKAGRKTAKSIGARRRMLRPHHLSEPWSSWSGRKGETILAWMLACVYWSDVDVEDVTQAIKWPVSGS